MEKFKNLYLNIIRKNLKETFGYQNVMQIPRLSKVTLNMGVGEAVKDSKSIDAALKELALITGQKPAVTKAKKSNAAFKIREGMPIGCKVTLRGERMYEFLERLVLVALPRIRDLKQFEEKNMDGNGNFSFGIKEHIVFPEIDYDAVDKIRGLDITIVTTAKTNSEGKELLKGFYFPFKK